ncbi:VC0807 family protein [Nocardia carnea]|uniref:VC0807 family protein n=1 Tax=Nocardia carnea TaxID=37328 RepID=UPI0024586E06|nr:VC0807 family protein [Nocardia carnea]
MNPTSPTANPAQNGSGVDPRSAIAFSLLVNAVAPIAVFYGMRAAGIDQLWALLLGLAVPAATATHSVVVKRRIDMLAGLVISVLLLSVGLSFLTGSPRTLLARDGWVTGLAGGWIFLTLLRTPYYLSALRLFTGGPLREQIDIAWRDTPPFRRVVYAGTMIWGSALLLDAATTVVLAYTMPVASVPLAGALKLVALIVLAEVVSRLHFRRKGLPYLVAPAEDTPAGGKR